MLEKNLVVEPMKIMSREMPSFIGHGKLFGDTMAAATLLACCLSLAACSGSDQNAVQSQSSTVDSILVTQVEIPKLKPMLGDVDVKLAADAAYPSSDPRNLEGYWAGVGEFTSEDGQPPPYLPAVGEKQKLAMEAEMQGKPTLPRGTLCRPLGDLALVVHQNQWPTQIIQRPEKIIFITEEGRGIGAVYMNAEHPKDIKPSFRGHSVGHWDGNTLVIDTVQLRIVGSPLGPGSDAAHVVTRIARANNGDKRNGDRLVIRQTIEDSEKYERPYSTVGVARWRPDMEVLEFNCEESTPVVAAEGLTIQ